MNRKKTKHQLDREVAKALKKPSMAPSARSYAIKKTGRELDREIADALASEPVTAMTITDAQIRQLYAKGAINERLRDLAITGRINLGPHRLYGRGPAVGGALDRLAVAEIFNRIMTKNHDE